MSRVPTKLKALDHVFWLDSNSKGTAEFLLSAKIVNFEDANVVVTDIRLHSVVAKDGLTPAVLKRVLADIDKARAVVPRDSLRLAAELEFYK